jgi:hypothetical protein
MPASRRVLLSSPLKEPFTFSRIRDWALSFPDSQLGIYFFEASRALGNV